MQADYLGMIYPQAQLKYGRETRCGQEETHIVIVTVKK